MKLFEKNKKDGTADYKILGFTFLKRIKDEQARRYILFGAPILWKSFLHKNHMRLIEDSLTDPKGLGHLSLMLHHAGVVCRHRHVFQRMRRGDVCIDCGAHAGRVIDMCRHQQATVYAFEPNPEMFSLLQQKYDEDKNVHLFNQAVWDKEGVLPFYQFNDEDKNFYDKTQSASIFQIQTMKGHAAQFVNVPVIDLANFIENNILKKHKACYFLKLDIEGAEFEVVKSLIEAGLHEKIKYIMCETHARFFEDGTERLAAIEKMIADRQIKNVFLDWF